MKGIQLLPEWLMCLVVAFLMQQTATVSAVYTMNQTCAYYAEGFIADPSSCQGYGYCKNGQLQGTGKCPNGYIYNSKRGICDMSTSNGCSIANVASICAYSTDNSFVADPNDCRRYCYCENNVAKCESCPRGQEFDSTKIRCVWKGETSTRCVADSICRLIPDGKFAGDPKNCGQYVACSNSFGISGQCTKGTYFNPRLGMCQANNPCRNPTPVGLGLGVLTPLESDPRVCKGKKDTFPYYVSDGKTCMGYHVCESEAGPGTWTKCPPGLHFNNGKCVTPFTFPCQYDRCGNIKQQFVGAIDSNCEKYLICRNQTSQGEASGYFGYEGLKCAGKRYFNEFLQSCDDKKPASETYKLCP